MKTYSDYMKEITADDLYRGLLVYGLFSDRLPPMFTMDDFWDYDQRKEKAFEGADHDYVYFEMTKNTGDPRPFGLPTPMAYQRLCEGLKGNWDKLQKHFEDHTSNQEYKISRIHIRKIKDTEKLFEMNYHKWWIDPEPEQDLLIGKKYIARSDISTCFPSIYTHSIPWALIGKEASKKNRKETEWFNQIDKLCRATKYGETHGLLIGPHASNLVAELILTIVDERLSSKYSFVRNIDDYECFVESYEEGERFIAELSEALREFDLPINRKKTEIVPLPLASVTHWVRKINEAIVLFLDSKEKISRNDIQAFLDTAVILINESKDVAVLKYCIKVIYGKKDKLKHDAIEYYIKTVFHLSFIYPYIMPYLFELVFSPFKVDISAIKQYANKLYEDAKRTIRYDALYYTLFFALHYDFEIKSFDYKDAVEKNDCLYKLLTWLYCKKRKISEGSKELRNNALTLKKKTTGNLDQYWIFVYEALPTSELPGEWAKMKSDKVSFLKAGYRP